MERHTRQGSSAHGAMPSLQRAAFRPIWLISIFVVLVLGFCAVAGVMLVELRRDALTQAETSAENLLAAVSQDIGHSIDLYDLSLRAVMDGLQLPDMPQLRPDLRQSLLFDHAATSEYLGAILVLNERGDVVDDSEAIPARQGNFSDRDYFKALQAHADTGLFISAPFQLRMTGNGELVVALSRRLNHPDGSFAGVVVGTMRLDYFRNLFSRFSLGTSGAVNLFRTDGVVLMRAPYDEAQIGRDMSASSNVRALMSQASGKFFGTAKVDNVRRLYNFTHIGKLPLVLNVALSEDDVYAAWRVTASIIGGVLLLLCVATSGLGWLLTRELRRRGRTEARTRLSEAQYRLLADHATDVIVRLNRNLTRRYVSPASLSVFGYKPSELIGRLVSDTLHPDDWARVAPKIQAAQRNRHNDEMCYRFRHRDGRYIWVEAHYSYVAEDGGFIVVMRDISERKQAETRLEVANAELTRLATTDGLTGIANRRRFDEVLEQEWSRAAREELPLTLLMLDVDRFKLFNDRYGHQDGDSCLAAVAKAIAACAERPADLVARYGGEEFVILLPDTDADGAAILAEQVRRAIASLELPHADNTTHGGIVTASIGSATLVPSARRDAASGVLAGSAALVAAADRMLYVAKRSGRNRVETEIALLQSALWWDPAVPELQGGHEMAS
jgi:diguanylate cyclase (GGDEF)-like protein/PAS domain S-box-containing protein